MKLIITLLLLVAILGVAGCEKPVVVVQDGELTPTDLTMTVITNFEIVNPNEFVFNSPFSGTSLVIPEGGDYVFAIETNSVRIVTINLDGAVTFGGEYTPDEAAMKFWEAITGALPTIKQRICEP